MQTTLEIVQVALEKPRHAADLLRLLDTYAADQMGGASPLAPAVRSRLVAGLADQPGYVGLLAYESERAVGLANCFRGYSTFRAAPLLNLHDLVVEPDRRGRGIGARLLAAVADKARELGCCKVTLEVQSANLVAQAAYRRAGFAPYELGDELGHALFWQRLL
jgi:GNAT superfamily N-acetyltransferase